MRDDNTVVNRPVARRSILWWIVPLLLLLLLSIGLLYYLMRRDGTANETQTNTNAADNATTQTEGNQSSATITNLSALLGTSDPDSVIGKKVSLSGAIVDEVIGDRAFTVGAPTDHVYALLDDKLDAGQAEQAIVVKAGETRSIQGTIIKVPSDMSTLMDDFQLSQEQADALKKRGFYISVSQTSVVDTDGGGDMPTGAGTE
jgi:hypothetical protein